MIQFAQVPSNTLIRLAGVELDRTGTSPGPTRQRTYILGQKTSSGSATADVAVQVGSLTRARSLFGQGSHLALMCEAYLANDPMGELWAVPVADNSGGTAAAGSVQVTAAATAAGALSLLIAGQLIEVGVDAGDTANDIASAINTAIGEAPNLPVTSTVSIDTVTITCRHKGVLGNDIDIRANYYTGQKYPAGVALTIVQPTSGATDPTLTTALAAFTAGSWRFGVYPYTTDSQHDALDTAMLDRWHAGTDQLLGGVFNCKDDTQANLTTWSADRNSPHASTVGLYASPTPSWQTAAAYAGACAKSLREHPAVPLTGRVVAGVLAPASASQFTSAERQTLGLDGVATLAFDPDGTARIFAPVTQYKTDGGGAADTTLQWVNAPYQVAWLIDDIQSTVNTGLRNKILVDDASVCAPGSPVVDVRIIRSRLLARYARAQAIAIVENLDAFTEAMVVERNLTNPNRVDVLYPADLANQLNVLAVLLRPYLQLTGE